MSYLKKEVNCTEPSPSVSVPCTITVCTHAVSHIASALKLFKDTLALSFAPSFLSHRTFLIHLIYSTATPRSIALNQPFNHFDILPKLCVYKLMGSYE
jgi:hypothetical protein